MPTNSHLLRESGVRSPFNPTTKRAEGDKARLVDLIWNMTLICPWDCKICCVDAVHARKRGGQIEVREDGLNSQENFQFTPGKLNVFEQAMLRRQQQGLELDLAGKLRILDHLKGFDAKLDFSGGDPLIAEENIEVMRAAARRFGRERVTVTATGPGLARYSPQVLAAVVGELNFTFDGPDYSGGVTRPDGYAQSNLRKARALAQVGVKTRAELPLTLSNIDPETLRRIYSDLNEAGIHKLLVMRLFPVGRGSSSEADMPNPEQYRAAIHWLRELEEHFGHPRLKLQCALRFFDQPNLTENPCDLFRESFGLMADGTLLASSWAINGHGKPLDDAWVLGNLANTPLMELLNSPKAQEFASRLNENFGHCKIHSFLNSPKSDPMDRIFDSTDPMYSPNGRVRVNVTSDLIQIGSLSRATSVAREGLC
jgi:MoaA/NifB/PqqE/SkfB family radical SAM enzyme